MKLILASAFLAITAHAQPLEFKGVPLGGSASQAMQALPGLTCTGSQCMLLPGSEVVARCITPGRPSSCITEYYDAVAFGPASPPESYFLRLEGGSVVAVTIDIRQRTFDGVVTALTAKYGPPTSSATATVGNLAGTVVNDRTLTWDRPDGVIVARERAGSLLKSTIRMATTAHELASRQAFERQQKGAAARL